MKFSVCIAACVKLCVTLVAKTVLATRFIFVRGCIQDN